MERYSIREQLQGQSVQLSQTTKVCALYQPGWAEVLEGLPLSISFFVGRMVGRHPKET